MKPKASTREIMMPAADAVANRPKSAMASVLATAMK
jgi:hypothetical protein